jgi:hypothetical protein
LKKIITPTVIGLAFLLGMLVPGLHPLPVSATAAMTSPSAGYTLHIDAQLHFPDHPTEIAHHWCKAVAGGMFECQIYDSDAGNARLVAVETIVGPSVYKAFSATEKSMWHYHKTEIPKVHATLPGMSPAQQKKTIAMIINTYGKIYVLFDPMTTGNLPIGKPTVTVLK